VAICSVEPQRKQCRPDGFRYVCTNSQGGKLTLRPWRTAPGRGSLLSQVFCPAGLSSETPDDVGPDDEEGSAKWGPKEECPDDEGPDEKGHDEEGPELSPDEVVTATILGGCRRVGNTDVGMEALTTGR